MPWHGAHLVKTILPAAIDSGVDATGFLTLAASGLPWAEVTIRAPLTSTNAASAVRRIRESTRLLPLKMSGHFSRGCIVAHHETPASRFRRGSRGELGCGPESPSPDVRAGSAVGAGIAQQVGDRRSRRHRGRLARQCLGLS